MTTRYYFVDPAPVRSEFLRMEVELAHMLKRDIADCVLSEDAVRQYTIDLIRAQDVLAHNNPRLRRVEITFSPSPTRHMRGMPEFLVIGQYYCPLRPVRKIQLP